jgi:plastocyanin
MSSRNWIFVVVVIAVLALGGWYFVAKSKSSTSTATPTPTMAMSSMTPQPSSSAAAAPQASSDVQAAPSVTIQNFAFSPSSITVKKGTTVTWTNKDSAGHTVTETDSKSGPTSGTLMNGQSYHFTFSTVGTFHYKCNIHPSMTGTVTVTE